jgi:hypothetical protein
MLVAVKVWPVSASVPPAQTISLATPAQPANATALG